MPPPTIVVMKMGSALTALASCAVCQSVHKAGTVHLWAYARHKPTVDVCSENRNTENGVLSFHLLVTIHTNSFSIFSLHCCWSTKSSMLFLQAKMYNVIENDQIVLLENEFSFYNVEPMSYNKWHIKSTSLYVIIFMACCAAHGIHRSGINAKTRSIQPVDCLNCTCKTPITYRQEKVLKLLCRFLHSKQVDYLEKIQAFSQYLSNFSLQETIGTKYDYSRDNEAFLQQSKYWNVLN